MEKGPKIKKNFGGNEAIPEFQKRKMEIGLQLEPKKPPTESPETLEGIEGGSDKTWLELVYDAKNEFPEEVQVLLDRQIQHKPLSPEERSMFDLAVNKWWKESFGITFANRKKPSKDIPNTKQREKKVWFKAQKYHKMEQLHQALKNLDEGEPVDEFRDETRRVLSFGEDTNQYFVVENGQKKYLGIGDIVSDYAWGIKYVPDGEMTEPEYRTLAKRILVNEVRRDLEKIHNEELINMGLADTTYIITPHKLEELEQKIAQEIDPPVIGGLAEIEIREFLNRLSLNTDLNFIVFRADAQEDSRDKYDFKIRVKRRMRGIDIETKNIKSVGFQLKTRYTQTTTSTIKYKAGRRRLVEEVVKLSVPSKELGGAVNKWFEADKPSGGPEQFLSRDLKIELLKAVTKGLIEINDEEIEKILPKGETQEQAN